jgi:hypothetical protein
VIITVRSKVQNRTPETAITDRFAMGLSSFLQQVLLNFGAVGTRFDNGAASIAQKNQPSRGERMAAGSLKLSRGRD